ncbi:class I SAM-dependent methyltransferase [Inhella proteolytica]|uniref:Class I SAM-dependent methyltransferase n=1 Tax=Inhella proteolytica TaxID=2795029 RepID=A0A931J6C3_9BURK|nr:class I SAM-dependent methyltransferase [Inhella proteolytica]MBH9576975.1 class I SAM-dependent methyltransferase [Inhella proteolytica]
MIGRLVRRLAGPFEPALASAYRGFFFNIEAFADRIAALGRPQQVVEIGCGEGALACALLPRLPAARYVGIDISPRVGRLFQGSTERAQFIHGDATQLLSHLRARADLVLVCDVMHHADEAAREALWSVAAQLVEPLQGRLVLKEWVRNRTPIYHLGYLSDRYITGDRVRYQTRDHWLREATQRGWGLRDEWSLKPWTANHALVLAPPSAQAV